MLTSEGEVEEKLRRMNDILGESRSEASGGRRPIAPRVMGERVQLDLGGDPEAGCEPRLRRGARNLMTTVDGGDLCLS